MKMKNLIDEDIVNYKKPSMFISTCYCDWKCCKEINEDICLCQNSPAYHCDIVEMNDKKIVERYLSNPITNAIVIAGFEPFLQFPELLNLIAEFRKKTKDDIVIYTGYYKKELLEQLKKLKKFENIIIKFGRFKPNQKPHFDKVLGVNLANKEQYAEVI